MEEAENTSKKGSTTATVRVPHELYHDCQRKMIGTPDSFQSILLKALQAYAYSSAAHSTTNPGSKKVQHHDMQGDEDLAYSLLNFVKNPQIASEFKALVDAVVYGARELDKKRRELTDKDKQGKK